MPPPARRSRAARASGPAAGQRPEPAVDRRRRARAGRRPPPRAAARSTCSASASLTPPGRSTRPGPARRGRARATRRAVAASPGTEAGVDDQQVVAPVRQLGQAAPPPAGPGRARPGRVPAPAAGRIRRAVGTSSRRRRPDQVRTPEVVAARHALPQRPRPEPPGGLDEPLPPHPGRRPPSRAAGRAPARAGRRRPAASAPGRRATGRARRPASSRPPHRRRRPPRSCGPATARSPTSPSGSDQPLGRLRQVDHRLGAQLHRGPEGRVAGRRPDDVHARRRGGRQAATSPAARSVADQHQVGPAPGRQGRAPGRRRPRASTPAAAHSADDGVVEGGEAVTRSDGHADQRSARATDARQPAAPRACGQARVSTAPVDGSSGPEPARHGPYDEPMTRPTAAFFDLDKTIIAKSSTLAFSREFQAGGLISRRAMLRSAYAQFVFFTGGADHDQMDKMRRVHVAALRRLGRRHGPRDRARHPHTTSSSRSSTTRRSA